MSPPAIVSLLSFSHYLLNLTYFVPEHYQVYLGILYSAIPSVGFGLWVMWSARWRVVRTALITSTIALALSPILPHIVVVMLNPIVLLYTLNNQGLKESVQVSKIIFLTHLGIMGVFIVFGVVFAIVHGVDLGPIMHGAEAKLSDGSSWFLPGLAGLTITLAIAGVGNAILGASGVESVMQIPEELDDPKTAVPRIYNWMLSILLGFGGLVTILLFLVLTPDELAVGKDFLVSMAATRPCAT